MASLSGDGSDRADLAAHPWLEAFHRGEHGCLEACYRDHFATVDRAVAPLVVGADRETLVHEVFFRLLTDESLRRAFRGGAFAAWLRVVARNQAIDYVRRRRLEIRFVSEPEPPGAPAVSGGMERSVDVRLTLERFRERRLPPKWRPVFDTRIVAQHEQAAAARMLGMRRTTLAYQEYRIRRLLRRFVLEGESR
jgi:RNA polymerase sigma-70 factor (ECF subfamily)